MLTAHRSKGLEWDLVVVADVQDGGWPDLRRRGSLLEADLVGRDGLRDAPTPQSLLVDERRLFYVALTRARRRLVLTAVQSLAEDGERPSRLLAETGLELPAPSGGGTALLSAGSLVARLRRTLEDPAASAGLRAACAAQLAALASARAGTGEGDGGQLVPAADPERWWGLADWTPGVRPVRPVEEPLALSGSGITAYVTCPLRWFLDRELKAGGPASAAQGFGTVLHALVQQVADGVLPADPDVLVDRLDAVWSALAFEAPWHAAAERVAAREALARFCRWAEHGRALPSRRRPASCVTIGDVLLRGSADRLELDADGRVHVVDFKTGKNAARRRRGAREPAARRLPARRA